MGSTPETAKMRILRGFLKSDEFGLGDRQPLRLEQQVVEIPVEANFETASALATHSV
jgi:hypothetical protein